MKAKMGIRVHQFLSFSKIFNSINLAPKAHKTKYLFFPGCSLLAYEPQITGWILDHLQEKLDMEVGSILKCCGKPTKNLGMDKTFKRRFDQLKKEIEGTGAEYIVVTCQSCLEIFEKHWNKNVISLWELFPKLGLPKNSEGKGKESKVVFNIHDSCSGREKKEVHDGIRWILKELGYNVEELENSREKTVCCGAGSLSVHGNYEVSQKIMKRRAEESTTGHMISYCSACRESLEIGGADSIHILELIFGDVYSTESMNKRNISVLKRWMNRFKSKVELKKRR
ncbi:(Fe-S)-binding protein [uncultured Ilyobacter sp.]|uniref:(Fe-S)-binding protein n=1 Tax=uncultured Ilyobacter sp. TaxID=544433 RepID=UPI0029C7C07D|nr:(Fe-S)-binding protein [uncultured Ilyobacter sp.]